MILEKIEIDIHIHVLQLHMYVSAQQVRMHYLQIIHR